MWITAVIMSLQYMARHLGILTILVDGDFSMFVHQYFCE